MRWDGWGAYGQYWDTAAKYNPPGQIRTLHPFSNDGSKPTYYLGSGSFGFTAIRKASADRVKELLGVLNYLASPFGSQEWLLLNFGVKDKDFTFDANGSPVLTQQGQNDVKPVVVWSYIAKPPPVLFHAGAPDFAKVAQSTCPSSAPRCKT
jgi:putative aldouronate transport system substrate-binding protein